jgi:hypothetical protein
MARRLPQLIRTSWWQLHWRGLSERWQRQDVTFDQAIEDGLQQVALILSGNLAR